MKCHVTHTFKTSPLLQISIFLFFFFKKKIKVLAMSVKNCMSIQCCKILFKFLLFMIIIISSVFIDVRAKRENEGWEWGLGPLIKRAERKTVISTENGEVSSVTVADGTTYHLQFITLEPNSLFLPVVLHTDMVFYVHTGIHIYT